MNGSVVRLIRRLFNKLQLNNQQPTTNNQQPTTNNQQPTTNNQQPTGSGAGGASPRLGA
jgi:hypothetical protein